MKPQQTEGLQGDPELVRRNIGVVFPALYLSSLSRLFYFLVENADAGPSSGICLLGSGDTESQFAYENWKSDHSPNDTFFCTSDRKRHVART